MINLIEILKAETASLKTQYIQLMKEYATGEYSRIEQIATGPCPKWNDFVTADLVRFSDAHYAAQKAYRKADDRFYSCRRIVETGFETFEAKMVKLAEDHYEDSIIKLAARIEKKGLNQEAIQIKTAHVGVNIETILTDGVKTVKAWTIIASGPIQKPHYRYLIK